MFMKKLRLEFSTNCKLVHFWVLYKNFVYKNVKWTGKESKYQQNDKYEQLLEESVDEMLWNPKLNVVTRYLFQIFDGLAMHVL